jgi:hypothetical protein
MLPVYTKIKNIIKLCHTVVMIAVHDIAAVVTVSLNMYIYTHVLYCIQAPSVCSSGRYSTDCGRSGSPLHGGPTLISGGSSSLTATTGTSSFSLGALQTSYGANPQNRQQSTRMAPGRYLPLTDHTHDAVLQCDGLQQQAAASTTNEEVS